MKAIDMHTHTTYSDGTLNPEELVRLAKEKGLSALAITDHDSTGGLEEGLWAGEKYGLKVIPGIELVARYQHAEIHILGYGIDFNGKYFQSVLNEIQNARKRRNIELQEKLNRIHLDISQEELMRAAGTGVITRMDYAKILVQKGFARNIRESFDLFLGEGKPAFVPREAMGFQACIEAIHQGGGFACLAHPYVYNFSPAEIKKMLQMLTIAGLDAVEAIYSLHTTKEQNALKEIARQLGLKITGGSDFHGASKPKIQLGTGLGTLFVPYTVLEDLQTGLLL